MMRFASAKSQIGRSIHSTPFCHSHHLRSFIACFYTPFSFSPTCQNPPFLPILASPAYFPHCPFPLSAHLLIPLLHSPAYTRPFYGLPKKVPFVRTFLKPVCHCTAFGSWQECSLLEVFTIKASHAAGA